MLKNSSSKEQGRLQDGRQTRIKSKLQNDGVIQDGAIVLYFRVLGSHF
jgi:hypothetical protein